MMEEQRSIMDDSSSETDPDEMFMEESVVHAPDMPSGTPQLHICPVCSDSLQSGLALERHLQSLNPLLRSFGCDHCESCFNTARQLSSHVANVHHVHKVACKECEYWTVSRAKMRLHVRKHTKGLVA